MPGYGTPPSIGQLYPLRAIIGSDDVTPYVADGLTFSNVDPGGYEMSSFVIPKDLPNTLRGQYIRIDSGLQVVWEGRISQVQRSLGNQTTITGEGYGALFKDNSMAQIFVDRDYTNWNGPSVQRQLNYATIGFSTQSPTIAADATTGNPAIVTAFTGSWATGGLPVCEAWYDGQGVPIHSIYYAWTINANISSADTNWVWGVNVSTDDLETNIDTTGNLRAAGPGNGTLTASAGNRTFGVLVLDYGVAGGTQNVNFAAYWQPAVYGNHGLTGRGSNPVGFYSSDIAAYVARQTPGLQPGNVQTASQYIIPHYVQLTPVTTDQIINDMSIAAGWHWGVWESYGSLSGNTTPRFDFCPRPMQGQATAFCMRSDCDTVDIKEDLSGQYNTAVITYTDVAGNGRQVTVTQDNPILDVSGIKRTVILNGGTMTKSVAQAFGLEALSLLYSQARVAGTVTISGTLSGPQAPWSLKAGIDRLRIGDLPSMDAFGIYNDIPISRVETQANSDSTTTTLEVGQGGNLVETLQARLSAAAVLAAQGGGGI